MKSRMVMLAVLIIFLCTSVLMAEGTTVQAVDPNIITFHGYIEAGLYFRVNSLTAESFNLLGTDELLPTGDGVDIGQWTLRVDNPPIVTTSFDIEYTFNPLSIAGVAESDTIEFELLVREETLETPAEVKNNNGITTVTLNTDPVKKLNTFTYIVAARLTSAGMESALLAAASLNYQSDITVTLIAD
ncbi:MAG: hypothetical protein WC182_05765 [Bacilli bacterium]